MYTIIMEVDFIMVKKKKKKAKANATRKISQEYCKCCGAAIKPCFQIQLTPKKSIHVCSHCFDILRGLPLTEIKEAIKKK